MLIVFQVINQLTETLLPYYSNIQQSKQSQVVTATDGKETEASVAAFDRFLVELERMGVIVLEPDHQLVVQASKESLLELYEVIH
jgi:ethanolamine utilization protein EutP (predicted NTPase)